ncbi:MAG: hypothetical protein AAF152_02420 [Cyanobacteria bacterium P01_A01_bin.114]
MVLINTAWSATNINNAIKRWDSSRARIAQHQAALAEIKRDAEKTQAAIDNHTNLYDSVTLTDYVCDPEQPPSFDTAPFAKSEPVNVADKNQRVIGYIEPDGYFTWLPKNCQD